MNIHQATQAELVSLISSDAPFPRKAVACERLAVIGDKDSVQALAGLLGDEKLSDFARIALQALPFPEAGRALREALSTTKGPALAGVVNSLACRQDIEAVPAILALAKQPESGALPALARLATPDALAAICDALKQTSGVKDHPVWQAVLEAAARQIAGSHKPKAAELLTSLLAAKPPMPIASAANQLLERAKAVTLFDGKSLDGWEGSADWFRVSHGAITAGSLEKPVPQNEFLTTTREFGDFELRLNVRLRHKFTNGGVQFRSQRVPNIRGMSGYQADAAVGYWGGIYDEGRRASFLGVRTVPEKIAAMVNPLGWNAYRIRCEGSHVRLWLNGILTSDFTETDAAIPSRGFIAVQLHAGNPTEVDYKDIELTELG